MHSNFPLYIQLIIVLKQSGIEGSVCGTLNSWILRIRALCNNSKNEMKCWNNEILTNFEQFLIMLCSGC